MITYCLVGFERDTDEMGPIYEIPPNSVLIAKQIAGIDDRPEIVADWPLSDLQASSIGEMIGETINIRRYEFALEPHIATGLRGAPGA